MGTGMISLDNVKFEVRSIIQSDKDVNHVSLSQLESDYLSLTKKKLPWFELGFTSCLDFLKSIPDTVIVYTGPRNQPCIKAVLSNKTEYIMNMKRHEARSKPKKEIKNVNRLHMHTLNKQVPHCPGFIRSQISDFLKRQLLKNTNWEGIEILRFESAFKNHYKYNIQYKHLGHNSWLDFFEFLEKENVVTLKRRLSGNHLVNISSNFTGSGISIDLCNQLLALIRDYPSGMSVGHMFVAYKKKYGVDLNCVQYGFSNIILLVKSVPGLQVHPLQNNTGYFIFLKNNTNLSVPTAAFPSNCVGPGYNIDYAEFNFDSHYGYTPISVKVSHVVNPGNFYVIINGPNNFLALSVLLKEINDNFCHLILAKQLQLPGLFCIARLNKAFIKQTTDYYFRGQIKMRDSDSNIVVENIDNGNRYTVSSTDLFLMKTEYAMRLPRQAIPASLAFVQPALPDSNWHPDVIEGFKSFVGTDCALCIATSSSTEIKQVEVALYAINRITFKSMNMSHQLMRTYPDFVSSIFQPRKGLDKIRLLQIK